MLDPIRKLLIEAGKAKQVRGFWDAAADILSEWAGCARVELTYRGLRETGSAQAGIAGKPGESFIADYHDAEGRHVSARFEGLPEGFPADALRSGLEIATHLAVMVARRSSLERERRLGTFLVELSRWLLAAPERELLLRYTPPAPTPCAWRRRWGNAPSSTGSKSPWARASPAESCAPGRRCSPTTSSTSRRHSASFLPPGRRARR